MVGSTSMTAIEGAPPRQFAVTGLGRTQVPNSTQLPIGKDSPRAHPIHPQQDRAPTEAELCALVRRSASQG